MAVNSISDLDFRRNRFRYRHRLNADQLAPNVMRYFLVVLLAQDPAKRAIMMLIDLANPMRFLTLAACILPWLAAATVIMLLI
jgi:hypothetical protein